MDEVNKETLDLSRRGLKKIEKAPPEKSKTIINLILDQNELQRLDNIDTYSRVENLSICNNFLLRMMSVSRLTNIRILSLNNNGILQIEGLKDMIYLKVLKLAGNNIKSIEHLNNNMHLELLDLSNNQICFISDISYLKSLKHLNLEHNRIIDLRQCDRYLPPSLEHLGIARNNIQDLNEISHLVHLSKLDSFTVQGNPCVAVTGKDQLGFDYRPFILNWIMSVKSIDGFVVSAIESLKAEWLYSQGKGRHYHSGQHQELCEYLSTTCPITADALETEDQRKLRLILSKAQHHQQQLKEHNHSPIKSKLQSPRMQSRMTPRHMGRSPDRLTSSFHSGVAHSHGNKEEALMTQSLDAARLVQATREPPTSKPSNQSLEAASKMVPVPESLMSPDYQDPIYDIQSNMKIPRPVSANNSSSNSSLHEEKRHIVPPNSINKNLKGSPKSSKSASSSPKLRSKLEQQRKGSLKEVKLNGTKEEKILNESIKKKLNDECIAAVTIQKMWRGYRSRNLNKDTLRILHAIQAARARQHIQRLTCDMEATKSALESERKIQQLQMQAINALWKKVSTLQANDSQKKALDAEENSEVLKTLTETCINLQSQVVELQGCMQEVLRAVSAHTHKRRASPVATQTDICAVTTPQEERSSWLKRPQTLTLSNSTASVIQPVKQVAENIIETPIEPQTAEVVVETIDSNVDSKIESDIDSQPIDPAETVEFETEISEDRESGVVAD